MSNWLWCVLLILPSLCLAQTKPPAETNNNPQAAATIARVKQATAYVKKHGKIRAAVMFQKRDGGFWHPPAYIFAFTCGTEKSDGFVVSDPATPKLLFQQHINNPIIAQLIKAALKTPAGAWTSYKWQDPSTGKVQQKTSYVVYLEKHKLCLGSGYYH